MKLTRDAKQINNAWARTYVDQINQALWLLAEKDYLLELERQLHRDQAKKIVKRRHDYIVTLQWLLAEARYWADMGNYVAMEFPWQS